MAPLLPSRSAALLALVGLSQAIEPPRVPHQPVGGGDRRLTFNETVVGPSLSPRSVSLTWSAAGEDGRYITTNDGGDLVLVDIVSGDEETFVTADALPADVHEYEISSDSSRMLIATNYTKQYRHSYFADYQVLDVKSGELTPLVDDQAGDVQYAKLAPTGDFIAFVRGNDLFLRDHATGDITRVTDNGGPDMFNGVFDWVYEEEVFGDRGSLWFSPDAEYVAFLSFNETGVETFTIPYYMDNQKVAPPYPRELELRYPKVGSTNPTVHLNVLEVATGKFEEVAVDAFPADDLVIGELAWVTDAHEAFIYRAYNRVQDHDVHVVVDPATLESRQVRERDGSDGWLENVLAIQYIGALKNAGNQTSDNTTYYVDLSDESGWMHIYLHPVQADGGKPIQLTSGEWEVKSILHVDAKRGLLYYSATKRHSTESHVYKLSLATGKSTPLVDDETPGYWSSSWSSEGGYYILSYQGPDVPYQEVYAVNSSKPIRVLEDNAAFYEKIEEYALPNITYFELEHPDGYSLNVMQMLPPDFDASKKHPILLTPYGGPNSQSVTKQFQSYGWEAYITSEEELGYITYTVDNRGTALKGREFRSAVTEQLGKLEPVDQTWAASELVKRFGYVDADKVGMFGWSFGGYLTAKTIELDAGVFSHGLIVAPVTDWRFYDSVYTERYMKRLRDNEAGYLETAVHDAAGFRNLAGAAALLHGTGDDNVHYANTAALFDLLVGAGVPSTKLDMTAFTDSDHSIRYNGANVWIYKLMTEKLYQEVQRNPDAGVLAHQWSRRQEERSD